MIALVRRSPGLSIVSSRTASLAQSDPVRYHRFPVITLSSVLLLGFLLGMRHATDPDHVIAVSTIVSRERTISAAAVIGVVWGIGHTITIVVVGGAVVLFDVVISPRLGLSLELSVALMLIALGVISLRSTLRAASVREPHVHPHQHGDYVHTHVHAHAVESHGHAADDTPLAWLDLRFQRLGVYQVLRPLIVGIVHGLAGSAAVALLVMAAIPNLRWAIAYLLVFGAGTIVGMMLITLAGAMPFAYTARRFDSANQQLRLASSMISIALGLFLFYQIGFVDGLFTTTPQWTPR